MPVKEWIRDLGDFRILVFRDTTRGKVTAFKVILVAFLREDWVCITRFDCAHGFAHQDILGAKSGQREKLLYPGQSKADLFQHAVSDFYENREAYLADFLAH